MRHSLLLDARDNVGVAVVDIQPVRRWYPSSNPLERAVPRDPTEQPADRSGSYPRAISRQVRRWWIDLRTLTRGKGLMNRLKRGCHLPAVKAGHARSGIVQDRIQEILQA
jgi:hypothetical protein